VEVEPFLIVGMVAARRLIVISAEAENLLGTAGFRDLMVEIGVLAGDGAGARGHRLRPAPRPGGGEGSPPGPTA
jgi:hypothetical protein